MNAEERKGRLRRAAGKSTALVAVLALLLLGGCSRLLSIVDPAAF